jgi:predicted DNA-binding protein (MmcQ/YjbR family)
VIPPALDAVVAHALTLPGATLSIQWGDSRVLKVGGKMFTWASFSRGDWRLSFKASDTAFDMLVEQPGFRPAPYLGRSGWVAIDTLAVLPLPDIIGYVSLAHGLIVRKLPKRLQARIASGEKF